MKKALSLMLALVLAFGALVSVPLAEGPFSIIANAASVEDFVFTLNSDGASYTLSGCNSAATGAVVVPSEYNGLPVTAIGEKAFYANAGITSVVISEGIVEIGISAFEKCTGIASVSIPETVTTIGRLAFSECSSLLNVVIPHEVSLIPNCGFYGCENLKSIKMLGNVKTIDVNAFKYCEDLKAIDIPETVTAIGDGAFGYTGITNMRLPQNIKYINKSTFNYCEDLEFVSIPKTVVKVYSKAFLGCKKFDRVYFSGSSTQWSSISIGSYNTQLTAAQTHYDVPAEEIVLHYESQVTVEATCLSDGEMLYTCPCGHSYTEVIPALGHDFTTEWTIEEADCIKAGAKYHYCLRCGEKADEEILPVEPDAHSFGEYIIDKEPTCTENGAKHKECAVCGAQTEAEAIAAAGHIAAEWVTVSETEKQKACSVCGEILETEIIETQKVEKLSTPKIKSLKNDVNGVKFSWSDVKDAEGYIVYRKVKGGKWENLGKITDLSYTDKDAKSGSTYYYTVKAYNGKVKSAYKSSSAIKFLSAPAIKDVSASAKGISFKWDKIKGAEGYTVYRKTASSIWVKLGKVKNTSFNDKTAKGSTEYLYTVKAYSKSYASAHRSGTAAMYLTAPTGLKLENTVNGIKIKWNAVKSVEGYEVLRKVRGGKWEFLGKIAEAQFIDETAKSSKAYSYAVKAYNGKCESATVTSKEFKFIAAPVLKEAKATEKNIEISWEMVEGAKNYTVYRKAAGGSWKKLATATKTSYTDKNVKKDTEYSYTVVANAMGATSAYDKEGVSAKLASPKKEEPKKEDPKNENVSEEIKVTVKQEKKGAKLSWAKVKKAKGYNIYRKSKNGEWKKIAYVISTSYTDAGVKRVTDYEYKVEACVESVGNYNGWGFGW